MATAALALLRPPADGVLMAALGLLLKLTLLVLVLLLTRSG
jgi:hypothetical protein